MKVTLEKLKRFMTNPGYAGMVMRTNLARLRDQWRQKQGYAPPPEGLTVFLTDRCNLRCSFCSQWGDRGVNIGRPSQIMAQETFEILMDQVSSWKPMIFIIGGEPFLYRHIIWTLGKIQQEGMRSFIITNGTLLERQAEAVVDSGLDILCISVDGPRKIHDRIRGAGTFDKIMAGIDAIERARVRLGRQNPEIHLAATISTSSYTSLPELAEILRLLPIRRMTIQHLSFLTEDQMRRQNEAAQRLFGIKSENIEGLAQLPGVFDLTRLKEVIQRLSETDYPFELGFGPEHPLDDIDSYYGNMEGYIRRSPERCRHIWRMTSILTDGQVTPCMNFGAGRITERHFLDIWNSPEYRHFRRTMQKDGYLPACHRCCNE